MTALAAGSRGRRAAVEVRRSGGGKASSLLGARAGWRPPMADGDAPLPFHPAGPPLAGRAGPGCVQRGVRCEPDLHGTATSGGLKQFAQSGRSRLRPGGGWKLSARLGKPGALAATGIVSCNRRRPPARDSCAPDICRLPPACPRSRCSRVVRRPRRLIVEDNRHQGALLAANERGRA